MADANRFLQLVGANEAEQRDPQHPPANAEARAMRIQIMHILHTFTAIFKTILNKARWHLVRSSSHCLRCAAP